MAANGSPRGSRALYMDMTAGGSPPASPTAVDPQEAEHPLRPLSPTPSDEFNGTPLASIRGQTERSWTRLGKVALVVAVPTIAALFAAAVLMAATARSRQTGQLSHGSPLDYDVLVVGAGAAGLAAARQLRMQGNLRVRHFMPAADCLVPA